MFHGRREPACPLGKQLNLIGRAAALRKERRLPILLADLGQVYICESEVNPWGTRRPLSWARLERMVEEAEHAGAAAGKPVGRERGIGIEEERKIG
jgi:hypothetical protein